MLAQTHHRRWFALIALLSIATLVAAACGPAIGDRGTLPPSSPAVGTPDPGSPDPSETPDVEPTTDPSDPPNATPTPAPNPTSTPRPTATPSGATSVKVYLFAGDRLVPVARSIDPTRAVGRAAMTELLAGPTAREAGASPALTTAIPAGTSLRGLEVANGLATVDLSGSFESGGGSASMFGRLAQVTFTLTQFPTVDRVAFRLDGSPVTVFSGEGIVLDRPSVRADFESFLPPVFVDRPAWGGVLGNPARLTGVANVFEASFMIEILDADGRALVRDHAMATCGTGCWGTFDVTMRYSDARRQAGQLVVYTFSARDGSVQDLRSYPVTLVP